MNTYIFKFENVYILVKNKPFREDVNSSIPTELVISFDEYNTKEISLYGGRVNITTERYGDRNYIDIDGISIYSFNCNVNPSSTSSISLETLVAYLNQIENLGIDSFLDNYKCQIQELKKECEGRIRDLEQDLTLKYDDGKAMILATFKNFVMNLACMIIMLMINMNAGLDNHCYTTAYDNIINLYF
ncbi:MAG: hypothetical protein J6R30_04700 [Bacteroidales bacterium]|nr:hypothetical protein [Bacteroidales bacterium]